MLNCLIGKLSSDASDMVDAKVRLRFKKPDDFVTPEALILHEQKIIPDERLLEACMIEYNQILEIPQSRYVPTEIINKFEKFPVVVIDFDASNNILRLATIPEFANVQTKLFSDEFILRYTLIPIYTYVELRTKQFGEPDFLSELPIKDKWEFIVQEALSLKASEITLSNTRVGANVYFNARKTVVPCHRAINAEDVDAITKMLASSAGATMADDSAKPRYFGIDVDKHNRGRVVVNKTYYGKLATIRLFPNDVLNMSLEDLNVKSNTIEFIRNVFLSPEKGLRLMIGETMSGKNTTLLCALNELAQDGSMKIVSLEQPVELLVDGIEQINAETDDEFAENADSLLRQNPDIVYFTEITERTAKAIMKQANTAKAVFSTIHANSIADVLFRLEDITQMSLDRIILTLHSCIYQELVRDDRSDTVTPYNRCMYFSEELKMQLFGKSIAEIRGILQGEESRWK